MDLQKKLGRRNLQQLRSITQIQYVVNTLDYISYYPSNNTLMLCIRPCTFFCGDRICSAFQGFVVFYCIKSSYLIAKSVSMTRNKKYTYFVYFCAIAVIISVIYLAIHWITDILLGIILAFAVFYIQKRFIKEDDID